MGKIKIDATPQDICTRAGYTKEKAVSGSVWTGWLPDDGRHRP